MANTYFKFKQFSVDQEHCAIKVGTDACLLGAWVATHFEKKDETGECLDIGTGTGVLSLMLAQKLSANITAIDIDPGAQKQAQENFKTSPWNQRLRLIGDDVKECKFGTKFDLIISNPPFFESDLKSADSQKNFAKHGDGLTFEKLVKIVTVNLNDKGSLAILLPFERTDYFEGVAKREGLNLNKKCIVRHSSKHAFTRSMLIFSSHENVEREEEISIRDSEGNYTPEFVELLRDYYLYL